MAATLSNVSSELTRINTDLNCLSKDLHLCESEQALPTILPRIQTILERLQPTLAAETPFRDQRTLLLCYRARYTILQAQAKKREAQVMTSSSKVDPLSSTSSTSSSSSSSTPLQTTTRLPYPEVNFSDLTYDNMQEKAQAYFASMPLPSPVSYTPSAEALLSDAQLFTDILTQFQGVCIGEAHNHHHPKKFILDHLELAQKLGVDTFFLESRLVHNEYQTLLNQDFLSGTLQEWNTLDLKLQDHCFQLQPPYTYMLLVQKALSLGMRIVSIDHSYSLENVKGITDNRGVERIRTMNYAAHRIFMANDSKGKFIVLTGQNHNSSLHHKWRDIDFVIPGCADLFQCPSIFIEDSTKDISSTIATNVQNSPSKLSYNTYVHTHVYIRRPALSFTPADTSSS